MTCFSWWSSIFHEYKVKSLTSVDCEQFLNMAKICGANFNIWLINIY